MDLHAPCSSWAVAGVRSDGSAAWLLHALCAPATRSRPHAARPLSLSLSVRVVILWCEANERTHTRVHVHRTLSFSVVSFVGVVCGRAVLCERPPETKVFESRASCIGNWSSLLGDGR